MSNTNWRSKILLSLPSLPILLNSLSLSSLFSRKQTVSSPVSEFSQEGENENEATGREKATLLAMSFRPPRRGTPTGRQGAGTRVK